MPVCHASKCVQDKLDLQIEEVQAQQEGLLQQAVRALLQERDGLLARLMVCATFLNDADSLLTLPCKFATFRAASFPCNGMSTVQACVDACRMHKAFNLSLSDMA